MFLKENKTLSPDFGVSNAQKTFFVKNFILTDGHRVHRSKAINIVYAFLK
jgi:hypothetical protein